MFYRWLLLQFFIIQRKLQEIDLAPLNVAVILKENYHLPIFPRSVFYSCIHVFCYNFYKYCKRKNFAYYSCNVKCNSLIQGLYRYGISNCLFEATYEKVLEICQCTPYFHWAGMKKYRRFCRGPALVCMNQVFDRIGEYDEVDYVDSNSNSEPNSNETNRKVQKVAFTIRS